MKKMRLIALAALGLLAVAALLVAWPGNGGTAASSQPGYPPGMVAYWRFDEGSGTTVHDFVGANHGTIYGATWTDGISGNALSFDGDDYVELPDIDIVPSPFTICAWVDIQDNSVEGNYAIVSRSFSNVPGGYTLGLRGSIDKPPYIPTYGAQLEVIYESFGGSEQKVILERSPMGWHCYCGSWDGVERHSNWGDGLRLYIDGELQTTNVLVTGSDYLNRDYGPALTSIGAVRHRSGSLVNFAIDPIDEVAIYDRVLAPEEVQQFCYMSGEEPTPVVGGIVEMQAGGSGSALDSAAQSSDGSPPPYYIALATGVAAGAIAVTAGVWYARRRWLR